MTTIMDETNVIIVNFFSPKPQCPPLYIYIYFKTRYPFRFTHYIKKNTSPLICVLRKLIPQRVPLLALTLLVVT